MARWRDGALELSSGRIWRPPYLDCPHCSPGRATDGACPTVRGFDGSELQDVRAENVLSYYHITAPDQLPDREVLRELKNCGPKTIRRLQAWGRCCVVCKSRVSVRRFALAVDSEPLRIEPDLCDEHGAAYLLHIGRVLREMIEGGGPRLPASSARLALAECFAEYCDEMGEGYDAETFIDFCVHQLIDPPAPSHRKPDAAGFVHLDGLPEWFREHADVLEHRRPWPKMKRPHKTAH